jgi:hypothetical protein
MHGAEKLAGQPSPAQLCDGYTRAIPAKKKIRGSLVEGGEMKSE